ncbi:hypothetical protein [Bradyrhizobium japonicum]|uniref:hypothetical protein n=1 Tax=Bradyrhizobium japonicum TaxID=375 RepID=UPI0012BC1596|nr:hypothetical protein [Bradyrhizobium japonicum]
MGESLPGWLGNLFAGWPMIRANLPIFAAVVFGLFCAIWWLMDWRYGSIISNRDAEIALLKGQRDDYKDKLNGATPDQAKARVDALEARLAALEPKIAAIEPRRLKAEQRAALIARLSPPPNTQPRVAIASEPGGDSPQFASDFVSAFRSAGPWAIEEGSILGIGDRPPSGIAVRISNPAEPPPEASIVIRALLAAGIKFDVTPYSLPPHLRIQLVICTKTELK